MCRLVRCCSAVLEPGLQDEQVRDPEFPKSEPCSAASSRADRAQRSVNLVLAGKPYLAVLHPAGQTGFGEAYTLSWLESQEVQEVLGTDMHQLRQDHQE